MKKRILSIALAGVLSLALTVTAFATTKGVTKTIIFNSYDTQDKDLAYKSTISVTNVIAQAKKDFSFDLTDDKKTISGKNSQVITCKAPVTLTLLPFKGEKHAAVTSFALHYDGNKVKQSTVKNNFKYYNYDISTETGYDFSKKLTKPTKDCLYADGSSYTLTKAGIYEIHIRPDLGGLDDFGTPLTSVFIIVK